MNHKKYRNLVDEYFFGEINSREKIELEEHLKNCELCRTEFYSAKALKESLLNNELPEPDDEPVLLAAVMLKEYVPEALDEEVYVIVVEPVLPGDILRGDGLEQVHPEGQVLDIEKVELPQAELSLFLITTV